MLTQDCTYRVLLATCFCLKRETVLNPSNKLKVAEALGKRQLHLEIMLRQRIGRNLSRIWEPTDCNRTIHIRAGRPNPKAKAPQVLEM